MALGLVQYDTSDEEDLDSEEATAQSFSAASTTPGTSTASTTASTASTRTANTVSTGNNSTASARSASTASTSRAASSTSTNTSAPTTAPGDGLLRNDSSWSASNGGEAASTDAGVAILLPPPRTRPERHPPVEEEAALEEFVKKTEYAAAASSRVASKSRESAEVMAARLGVQRVRGANPRQKRVRITIPTLSDFPSDEDEDEHERKAERRKRLRAAAKGSGLTALLPAPQHAATKTTNRPLLPHSLTKKPDKVSTTSPATPKSKPSAGPGAAKPSIPLVTGVDPDSDEEDSAGDFFSLTSEPATVQPPTSTGDPSLVSVAPTPSTDPVPSSSTDLKSSPHAMPRDLEEDVAVGPAPPRRPLHLPPAQTQAAFNNEPLYGRAAPYGSSVGSGGTGQFGMEQCASSGGEYGTSAYEPAPLYQGSADPPLPEPGPSNANIDQDLLEKIRGRRGEKISFIEVSGHAKLSEEEYLRNLTDEANAPQADLKWQKGGREKSKHQITYLAHMAKAQEAALKNQWSQNKASKRQTQSKYGF